jgi:membrane-anchored protein YejM (alkaline phosphatase superfamily)
MGWFAMANAVLLALIGMRYFSGFSAGGTLLSWIYVVLIYPAHHVLLAAVPLFLLVTPVVFALPRRRWVTALGVFLYAAMIAVILLDSLLWSQSRFHLNALTMQILGWQSWVFAGSMFVLALVFESLLAARVWSLVRSRPRLGGAWVGGLSLAAVVASQLIHAWADAAYYVPVTSVGQQLPVYEGFTAKRQLTRLGLVDPAASREREAARRLSRQLEDGAGQVLDYPLNPLECRADQPLNLLLILADAMRADVLNQENAPFLWRFAHRDAQWFAQHFSGGNSSRMGVFSLFYGLPPGYWSSFEALQRSPVLVDELQRQGYRFGLFSSSTMYRPVSLDRTAFANVPSLKLGAEPAGAPGWQRDRTVAAEWHAWLDRHAGSRPFFGFLFFDASNTQDYPPELDGLAELGPQRDDVLGRRFSDYRKSVRFVDGLIAGVVADLQARGVAERTVIVITSDHGEEFDESGAGLRDHGSGFTRYQLQVPMLVRWPGRAGRRYDHRTSHYDVVPTLMQDLLGCSNPPSDYASGRNLFAGEDWSWLLAGSYYNYAVLESDQITITYPNGRFEVRDWNYRIRTDPEIRGPVLQSVTRENSRFYRQ